MRRRNFITGIAGSAATWSLAASAQLTVRVIKIGFLLSAVLVIAAPSVAHAVWCASYKTGGENCGFSSQAQCQAAISGAGGWCIARGGDAQTAERTRERAKTPPREKERTKVAVRKPTQAARDILARPDFFHDDSRASCCAGACFTRTRTDPSPAPTMPAAPVNSIAFNPTAFAVARQFILDGRYEAGLAAMQASGPDSNADVASYIGLALRKLGRIDEARSWYDRALSNLAPPAPDASRHSGPLSEPLADDISPPFPISALYSRTLNDERLQREKLDVSEDEHVSRDRGRAGLCARGRCNAFASRSRFEREVLRRCVEGAERLRGWRGHDLRRNLEGRLSGQRLETC
jgi:hypothetical protein